MEPTHISLGPDCSIAWNLQAHKLKGPTLPFDWVKFPSLTKLLSLIELLVKFGPNELISPEYIQESAQSGKFYIVGDDWDEQTYNKTKLVNVKYNIAFPHDISDGFADKYARRVSRFVDILTNPDLPKRFYRIGTKSDEATITKTFDALGISNYKIIIIENQQISPDAHINIENIWKRPHLDWASYFA